MKLLKSILGGLARIFLALFSLVWPTANPNKKQQVGAEPPVAEPPVAELDIWEQNRQLHNKLKQGWDSQQLAAQLPLSPLTEYCVDALGNIYYINAAGLDINVDRVMAIERARIGAYHGIDDEYMIDYLAKIDKALADADLGLIRALHSDFKIRKNKLPAMEKLLHLACLYLYRHDENPYSLDLALQQVKVETAKRIPELRAFFLRLSWAMIVRQEEELSPPLRVWSNRSETDFLNYLAGQSETRETKTSPSQNTK